MNFSNQDKTTDDGVKRIQVTHCHAFGKQFENLKKDSIHELVNPPEGYEQGDRGYWVQGVGEPVLVLHNECKELWS